MRFIYTARQGPSIPENARLWEAGAQFFERDGPRPFIWKIAHASHRRIAIVASAAQSNYPARWWKPLPDGRILANSPQAKGRVERRNGLLQDRLVKALRLRGISDLAGANRYLEQEFLRELNGQFTVAPPVRRTCIARRLGICARC